MTEEIPIKTEPDVKEEEEPEEPKPLIVSEDPPAEGSEEDEEEEEETPAGINIRRETHAPQVDVNQLHKEPDFAVVCSFFNKFGAMIGMKPLSFTKLESLLTSFEADGRVNKELMDIHMMLMRRIRMLSVRAENWENYLKKFLAMSETTEEQLFQVERYGYVNLPVTSKIQILKALCDAQFDFNPKMKENMATACRANNLRLIPLGMDKNGLIYWYQQDCEYNIRIYTEEPDDLSGVTWTLVVRHQEDLDKLIERLKVEDLGYKKKESDGKEKQKDTLNADPQAQMLMSTKKGTFIDLYLDDAAIKRMREFLIKQKEERKTKREGKKEAEQQEEEVEEEEEENQDEDLDKRVIPRRSAASKAASNIRKFVTPKRSGTKRPKKSSEAEGEDEEKDSVEEDKDSEEKKDGSEETASDEDEEDEEEGDFTEEESEEDEDDEFKPKSEKPKKKRRKRGPKKKKPVVDDDDEDETDEEEIQKERKMATGDSACGQCKKSCDWDVLLLCDVCDDAWHTYCLKPMLWFVPDGDWFCPKCVHGMLIEKMEEVAKVLDENLKKKTMEEKKKKAAADRLRREMEYIGVSLNNIIPTTFKKTALPSSSSSSDDEDTTQRKSKRKAVKKIAPRSRFQMEVMQTIAEGRSRRRTQKVDYNFKDYDEAIQDACDELGEEPSRHGEIVRPSGAGRGKDMANIIEAERRISLDENGQPLERLAGKPAKIPKPRKKLNDLDLDNMEESESDEYQANDSDQDAADEEEEMSGSEYVPSEDERRTRRGGGGGRGRRGLDGPTLSDEEFVVSDSDGSYGYRSGKIKRKLKEKKPKPKRWASDDETSEEEAESDESYYSDDSRDARRKQAKKAAKSPTKNKWTAKEESEDENEDDEDEEEQFEESEDEDAPRTQSGRKMRKVVAQKPKVESDEDEEDEEEEEETKVISERPVGALDRVKKRGSDSEGEFKPDDEEDEEEEDEDEEEEEDNNKEEKKKTKKRRISDSDEDSDEEEVDDSKRLAPRPPKLAKPTIPIPKTTKSPVKILEKPKAPETSKEPKPQIKIVETESAKTNGAAKELEAKQMAPMVVNIKQEQALPPVATPSPRPQAEMKPLTIQHASAGGPSSKTPPIPQQMTVPPASYGYPPHPGYYQGGPPPPQMMPPHGMPPGYGGMPPGAYPNPYGQPPPANWQGPPGPYGTPAPGHVPNPYAQVHNPYAHQGPPPPTSSANYNDLQSL